MSLSNDIPYFSVIFARSTDGAFGNKGKVPWSHSGDMTFFRKATTGSLYIQTQEIINKLPENVLIMGHKTWISLGSKPLSKRKHIVVASGDVPNSHACKVAANLDDALILAKAYKSTIFVIGGTKLLQDAFKYSKLERIYETTVTCTDVVKCDVKFTVPIPDRFNVVKTFDLGVMNEVSATARVYHCTGNDQISEETGYMTLAKAILQKAESGEALRDDRTKVKTYSIFGPQIEFDLQAGFPLLTTKDIPFRLIKVENLWFLRGDTNIDYLLQNNVHIWDDNTSRSYLDKYGFSDYPVGELGPGYGQQWRKFGKPYVPPISDKPATYTWTDSMVCVMLFIFWYTVAILLLPYLYMCKVTVGLVLVIPMFAVLGSYVFYIEGLRDGCKLYKNWILQGLYQWILPKECQGIDQIAEAIKLIKTNPGSRRILVSAWNPAQIFQVTLPPCHVAFQFYVERNKLSCKLYQRSCDLFLGAPFNIAGYSWLVHTIAKECDLDVGTFIYSLGDTHIYSNAIEQMKEQVSRPLRPLPKLIVTRKAASIDDYTQDDYELTGYHPHAKLWAKMAV
jgi:thymidylate synthase